MEKKQKPSQEKNKRFLEKNMELTSINRNLEEKIKTLSEENTKLVRSKNKKGLHIICKELLDAYNVQGLIN